MLGKPLTIFLAVVVFVANTYCACASAVRDGLGGDQGATEKSHSHCHPAPSRERRGCHDEKPADEDHGSHTCGHCTGTVTADAAKAKTMLPSPDLGPALYANITADHGLSTGSLRGGAFDHSGLPPPLPPPTLFHLSCSLNN
jgi:hypothetical protein